MLVLVEMALTLVGSHLDVAVGAGANPAGAGSNTRALGGLVYTEYVYPFEIAAVILLVAIIAAIALTHRKRKETKYQNPARSGEGAAARSAAGPRHPVREAGTVSPEKREP